MKQYTQEKDNHTLGKNPGNLTNWVKIVRKAIDKVTIKWNS